MSPFSCHSTCRFLICFGAFSAIEFDSFNIFIKDDLYPLFYIHFIGKSSNHYFHDIDSLSTTNEDKNCPTTHMYYFTSTHKPFSENVGHYINTSHKSPLKND